LLQAAQSPLYFTAGLVLGRFQSVALFDTNPQETGGWQHPDWKGGKRKAERQYFISKKLPRTEHDLMP
jgi:hypothetical protein